MAMIKIKTGGINMNFELFNKFYALYLILLGGYKY